MSFVVPRIAGGESNLNSNRIIPGNSENLKVSASGLDKSGLSLLEEAADVEDTLFPTRMTGIAASVSDGDEEFDILKNLNNYDSDMYKLASDFNGVSEVAENAGVLEKYWDDYQNQAVEIHKSYLKNLQGKKSSRLFGQSFVEHLNRQREKFENKSNDLREYESVSEIRKATDNTLKMLGESDIRSSDLSKIIEHSFNQACEEAVLTGMDDEQSVIAFAGKRMVPVVQSTVENLIGSQKYSEALSYLDKFKSRISQEDRRNIGRMVYEQQAVAKACRLLQSGDEKKADTFLSALPERLQKFARLSVNKRHQVNANVTKSRKEKAVKSVLEEYLNSGEVRTSVIVDGQTVMLEPEDYENIISSEQGSGKEG